MYMYFKYVQVNSYIFNPIRICTCVQLTFLTPGGSIPPRKALSRLTMYLSVSMIVQKVILLTIFHVTYFRHWRGSLHLVMLILLMNIFQLPSRGGLEGTSGMI